MFGWWPPHSGQQQAGCQQSKESPLQTWVLLQLGVPTELLRSGVICILLMPILHAYLAVGLFVQLTHQMLQPTVHILVATLVLVPAIHPDCSRNVAVLIDHYMQTLKMIMLAPRTAPCRCSYKRLRWLCWYTKGNCMIQAARPAIQQYMMHVNRKVAEKASSFA